MSMKEVSVLCLVVSAASYLMAVEKNLIQVHRNAGKTATKECLSCHAGIMSEASLNKKFKTFHRVHLESRLEAPKDCSDCHDSVDLREGSTGGLRKHVDPELCAGCHTGDLKGAKVLFLK